MTDSPRLLAVMGSGETAPSMAKVHRELFGRLGPGATGVLLETPYGFQENVDDLSERAIDYLERNVGARFSVARWRSGADAPLVVERALAAVREGGYVFAGPGSPSYALAVWQGSPLRDVLEERLARPGSVTTFASAAAVTLGVAAVPVYEIYKVGAPPHWLDGLDLLAAIGLSAAVIPHYDNAEGGTHDTRFCYLGEQRLARMESMLPDGAFVLGVDEHTAAVFDLAEATLTVVGRGAVTVRRAGVSKRIEAGATVGIDQVAGAEAPSGRGVVHVPADVSTAPAPATTTGPVPALPSLRAETERLEEVFDDALAARDADGAVAALLDLDQAIVDWSTDSDQNDHRDRAHASLRRMITQLGESAAKGMQDPLVPLVPFVEALLDVRAQLRAAGSFDLSDAVRRHLDGAGIDVHDTPEGTSWSRRDDTEQRG